jgi:hypothetical protein
MKRTVFFILSLFMSTFGFSLNGKVTFEMPSEFKDMGNNRIKDSLEVYQYYIKTDTINSKAHYSNALLQIYTVPDTVNLRHADGLVAYHTKGAKYILSAKDGDIWKTYLFVNNERKEQYVILYRIGIYKGICVEFMISYPNIREQNDNQDATRVLTLNEDYVIDEKMSGIYCGIKNNKDMVNYFNLVCSKLKILNNNEFKANVEFIETPTKAEYYHDKSLREIKKP